jgi:cation diffusion facilitator family transporter
MSSSQDGSTKVIVIALLANVGIAIAKFIGAFVSRSASLMAEAIHSLVDCSNQVLLLIGAKSAAKPPTEKHPLGFGREAFFWSFIVAIFLFSLGGLFAIYEGLHKLNEPAEIGSPLVGLSILVFAIILEGYSFYSCYKEVKRQNIYGSLWKWFRKTTSAELLVIFTEDAAALVGLIVAALALTMAWITGDVWWDAMGSVVVGAVLVIVAVFLAIEIKSLIVGEAPSIDLKPDFDAFLRFQFPTGRLLKFISLQIGANEIMISAKIHPGDVQLLADAIAKVNLIEKQMRHKHRDVKWQFIELDYHD